MTRHHILAADIGGGHITAAVVDQLTGALVPGSRVKAPIDSKGERDAILDAWASCLNMSLQGDDTITVDSLAFAMPGPFNYRTGIAHFGVSDKYQSLCDLDIAKQMSPRLAQPLKIRFINDATAFAVGETLKLAKQEKQVDRVLAITLGTGFGSAFIEQGVPVTRGELVPPHGSLWHLPYRGKIFDDFVSVRWLHSQFSSIRDDSVDGVREIAAFARKDERCAAIFHEYGVILTAAIIEWIVRFGANCLIIGGNIAGAFDLFGTPLEMALANLDSHVEIVIATDTDNSAIRGAARLFEESFWDRIKNELPTQ